MRQAGFAGLKVVVDRGMVGCKRAVLFNSNNIIYLSPAMMSLLETDRIELLKSLTFLDGEEFVKKDLEAMAALVEREFLEGV